MKTIRLFLATLLLVPVLFIGSCKKDADNMATGQMNVRMMDDPAPYGIQEVNIDVHYMEVHIANEAGDGWYRLQTVGGIYNVLTLCNGIDTLIVHESLPVGQITSIRLVLGPNNSMKKDNVIYPLSVPSGEESGLKINVHENISAVPLNLFIDFDAGQSIVQNGNGEYHLKPVIHAFTAASTGSVIGVLSVPGPGIAVMLSNGTHSHYSYAEMQSGRFMVRGLTPGVYTATVYTANTPIVISNITVTANGTTDMGIVHIP